MTARQMAEYEKETGVVIVNKFQQLGINPDHTPAVLVKNHGPFSWGTPRLWSSAPRWLSSASVSIPTPL